MRNVNEPSVTALKWGMHNDYICVYKDGKCKRAVNNCPYYIPSQ